MLASFVLAASLVGQQFVGPPLPPHMAPAVGPVRLYVVMPGPSAEDVRIQAAMDAYAMDPNAGMFNRGGGTLRPFPTRMLRRDTPAGVYMVGAIPGTTPIPLMFVPYLGQSPTIR